MLQSSEIQNSVLEFESSNYWVLIDVLEYYGFKTFPMFKLQSTYKIFLNLSKGGVKQALASVGNFMQFDS